MTGIYRIENLINHKNYIGQTTQMNIRWGVHKRLAFEPNAVSYNYPLYKAIRKYGLNNFNFTVIEECAEQELDEKVTIAIQKRCSKKVNQYAPDGQYLQTYSSVAEAGRSLGKGHGCIARVCRGEGKLSYGFIWKYASDEYPIGEDLINGISRS